MSAAPDVTVLIPTWNAGPEFPENLARIRDQRLDRPFEILVIDSGSSDGTADFLRRETVRLIEIPKKQFNHGLTRNLGVREARGEILVLTVQDARPADDSWMQRLVDCFSDPAVAGAYSRQIPRADANPFIRDRLSRWSATAEMPRVQAVSGPEEFAALPPLEKLARATFDNVSSSVRRRIALEIPFRELRFGEDLDWGHRVILAGHKVVYEPRSRVVHSHENSMWYELKRVYLDHQNLHRLLGVHTVPRWRDLTWCTLGGTKRLVGAAARDDTLGFGARLLWWSRAPFYALTQNLAQFLGARSVKPLENGSALYRRIDRLLSTGV